MEVKLLVKLQCVTGDAMGGLGLCGAGGVGEVGERHYLSHQPGISEVVTK